jgi:hypothetical protein
VVPAVDDAHFSRREFGQDDRDEVLYFHGARAISRFAGHPEWTPAARDDFRPSGSSYWREAEGGTMSKIVAGITMSVDGYITGPDDGPGQGLGVGGERLHYWVFGGP